MRSNPAEYELVAPRDLQSVMKLMANPEDAWTPIAGGTDLMVQYAAGKLVSRKLVSIWNLPQLREIETCAHEIRIGAACTYTDLQRNETVAREFPMLVRAAGWIGSIANQNRGTIGGNIVNASPAADSLPSLLAYGADLILVSFAGERRIAYSDFHAGYKSMRIAPTELIRSVCLERRFARYNSYTRKVGTRNAQAISKVCIAALGLIENGVITDVRIALGSVAPVPVRLTQCEQLLLGKRAEKSLIARTCEAIAAEISPIDDIRSTAKYRAAVAGNLVAEFLEKLFLSERRR